MQAGNHHTAPTAGPFVSEVRQVELHVKRAHELVATLLERRHSKPTTSELVGAAQQLRFALRVLESLLFGETGQKSVDGITAIGVCRALSDAEDVPMRIRVVALQAVQASKSSMPTTATVLSDLAAWVSASVFALGMSAQQAAEKLAETETFHGHEPRALLKAYTLHERAVRALEVKS